MNIGILYYLLFFVGLCLSLFTLFSLSKNDFVLLRRGVALQEIFDDAFLAILVGLLGARLFYIFDSFQFSLFNPIQFLHIFLYPGFSIYGFFVGFFALLAYFFVKKKAFARAFDLYSVSFLFVFISYLIYGVFVFGQDIFRVGHLVVTILILMIAIHCYKHFSLKDATLGIFILWYMSLSYLISALEMVREPLIMYFSISQIVATLGVVCFFVLLILNQFIFKK